MIPIPGSSRPETITDSLRAAELELTEAELPGDLRGGGRRLSQSVRLTSRVTTKHEREDAERCEDEGEIEPAGAGGDRGAADRQLGGGLAMPLRSRPAVVVA